MIRTILIAGIFAGLLSACMPYSQIRKTDDQYVLVQPDGDMWVCDTIARDALSCKAK